MVYYFTYIWLIFMVNVGNIPVPYMNGMGYCIFSYTCVGQTHTHHTHTAYVQLPYAMLRCFAQYLDEV